MVVAFDGVASEGEREAEEAAAAEEGGGPHLLLFFNQLYFSCLESCDSWLSFLLFGRLLCHSTTAFVSAHGMIDCNLLLLKRILMRENA